MKYVPLNDYVIVQKIESSKTTSSGIILQSTSGADNARVVAVPDDVESLKENDVIMLRWSNALKVEGDIYAISLKEIVCSLT